MAGVNVSSGYAKQIFEQLQDMQNSARSMVEQAQPQSKPDSMSFTDHLQSGIEQVNGEQRLADKMSVDLATGKTENIHETMLQATKAELSFNLMVQLRNKALEAYTEVMRMPV